MEIKVLQDILHTNKEMAAEIKELLKKNNVYMINIMIRQCGLLSAAWTSVAPA